MRVLITAAVAALALAACGGGSDDESKATSTPAAAAGQADLGAIKAYLLEHTERLKQSTAQLQTDAEAYYELAKGDYPDWLEPVALSGTPLKLYRIKR